MTNVTNTNYPLLGAQTHLNKLYKNSYYSELGEKFDRELGQTVESLTSSDRIHNTKDDAAGQASFNVQISGLAQGAFDKAVLKINNGILCALCAKDVLNKIDTHLHEIRKLTVEALNGVKSASHRDAMQAAIHLTRKDIDSALDAATYEGQPIFKTGQLTFQVGYKDGETVTVDLQAAINTKTLGLAEDFNIAGPQGATIAPTDTNYLDTFGALSAVTTNTVTVKAEALAADLGIAPNCVTPDTTAVVDSNGYWYVKVNIKAADATESRNIKVNGIIINVDSGENKDYYGTLYPENAEVKTTTGTAAFTFNRGSMTFSRQGYIRETGEAYFIDAQFLKIFTLGKLNPVCTVNPLQQLDLAIQKVSDLHYELDAVKSRMVSALKDLGFPGPENPILG